MTRHRILHVVGLGAYGGLEHLFVSYLGTVGRDGDPPAVAVKAGISDGFREAIRAYPGPLFRLKYLGPFRVPGLDAMRNFNRRRILAAAEPTRVVFWSSFPDPGWRHECRRAGAEAVYYDHGRSWQVDREAVAGVLAEISSAITVSEAGRRVLREHLGYTGPIHVVPNGVRFAPQSAGPRTDNARTRFRIGFAGRLVDKKGVPVLLRAAERLRRHGVDFELALAGDGPGRSGLQRLARELGLAERTAFLGEVRDMSGFYAGLDVLVMPSLQEPFGLTSVEAAAHGVPVVAARVDGLAATIREGVTGFSLPATLPLETYESLGGGRSGVPRVVYDPDRDALRPPRIVDPGALAELLGELAGEREALARMGERGAGVVQERFGMERYADRLNRALEA